MPKDIVVPQSIRNTAQKAIDYNLSLPVSKRAAYKDDGDKRVAGTGMRTARRLVSGRIDEKQVRLMAAWFARHGESEAEKEARKDKTSKASIAWNLWGGSQSQRWSTQKVKELDKKK